MKRSKLFAGGLTVACVVMSSGGAALAADVAADFSITNGNPNGAWRYGYTPTLTSGYGLTLLTTVKTNGQLHSFQGYAGDGTPFAGRNFGATAFESGTTHIPAGKFAMHTAPNGETMVARYTVGATDLYNLSAAFSPGDDTGGSVTVHVLRNGVQLFNSAFSGNLGSASYSPAPIALAAGDTVDFAVGPNGSYAFDMIVVDASITVVPEPATVLGLAMLGGLAIRRRR